MEVDFLLRPNSCIAVKKEREKEGKVRETEK